MNRCSRGKRKLSRKATQIDKVIVHFDSLKVSTFGLFGFVQLHFAPPAMGLDAVFAEMTIPFVTRRATRAKIPSPQPSSHKAGARGERIGDRNRFELHNG